VRSKGVVILMLSFSPMTGATFSPLTYRTSARSVNLFFCSSLSFSKQVKNF